MAEFNKKLLSGSADGAPITITSTSGASPTTIHACPSGTDTLDEIFIFTVNNGTSDESLTINFGGTNIIVPVAAGVGLITQIPGLILQNAKTVTAYAGTADIVQVVGFVNRITL